MQDKKLYRFLFQQKYLIILLVAVSILAAIFLRYQEYVYLFFSKKSSNVVQQSFTGTDKIKIDKDWLYDLSGSEARGGSDPYKLFDENCDPKHRLEGEPHSSPLPESGFDIFFKKGKGLRIVIDLQVPYKLTDIYAYERGAGSDSVWIYTGDMHSWKEKGSLRTSGKSGSWGWKKWQLTDTVGVRYVMVRFNSEKSGITEMAIYGKPLAPVPARPSNTYTGPRLPKPTLRQFMGVNSYDQAPLKYMQPFYQTRLYQSIGDYDDDSLRANPKAWFSFNKFNLPKEQQLKFYIDSLRQRFGNQLWVSIRGVPAYLKKHSYSQNANPVTLPGMDPENPLSYERHAYFYWNLIAAYGSKNIDTNLLAFHDIRRFSGAGILSVVENGNEEDAWWVKDYWSPVEYYAVSSADYDGDEKRLGPQHGIAQADPNSRLMVSGMVQLDTQRLKVLNFLCQTLRSDKQFIWQGGVQYHCYCNDGTLKHQPTKGLTPETFKLREKLAATREAQYKVVPGVPAILGENGYDRNQASWQRVPLVPGYTAAQSQGIMTIRSVMAAFMSGFDAYNYFMLRNATNEENPTGTFGSSGMISGPAGNTVYPVWYYWRNVVNKLADYQPDKVITEAGDVWVYKLRNKQYPDSVAYYLVSPTKNGTILRNYNLKLAAGKNKTYRILNWFSATENLPNDSDRPITGDAIQIDVSEVPVFVLMKE